MKHPHESGHRSRGNPIVRQPNSPTRINCIFLFQKSTIFPQLIIDRVYECRTIGLSDYWDALVALEVHHTRWEHRTYTCTNGKSTFGYQTVLNPIPSLEEYDIYHDNAYVRRLTLVYIKTDLNLIVYFNILNPIPCYTCTYIHILVYHPSQLSNNPIVRHFRCYYFLKKGPEFIRPLTERRNILLSIGIQTLKGI